jgi:UDP-N-acetyl-D-mannosaminuronic acid dehydrogenase
MIALDLGFIVDRSPEESQLIPISLKVKDRKLEWVIERMRNKSAKFKKPVIGCLGLAFKAE